GASRPRDAPYLDGGQRARLLLPAREASRPPGATPRLSAAQVAVAGRRVELRPEPGGDAFVIPREPGSHLGPGRVSRRDERRSSARGGRSRGRIAPAARAVQVEADRRADQP